jgi:signal transduction histidine kinase
LDSTGKGISSDTAAPQDQNNRLTYELLSTQVELEELKSRYADVYDSAPVGYLTLGRNGLILEANLTATRHLGPGRDDPTGTPLLDYLAPEDRERFKAHLDQVFAVMTPQVCEVKINAGIPLSIRLQSIARPEHGEVVCRSMFSAITGVNQDEEVKRFLAKAGMLLVDSLDYHTTLANIAGLCVPYLADWCVVDIADEDDTIERVVVTHADPGKADMAQELQRRYPPPPEANHIVSRVVRTGEPDIDPQIADEVLVAAARDEDHLEILRALGPKSHMIVPMTAHGRTLGAITFVSAESGRLYGPTDLETAQDLAGRAAIAVDNARLYLVAQEASLRDRRHVTQLMGLTRAALFINAALSVEEVLQTITERARGLIGAHQAITCMALNDNWAESIKTVSLSDKYGAWRDYEQQPDGSGIYTLVIKTGRAARMTQAELEAHPLWQGFGAAADAHPPMRGWLAAPLMGRDGHTIGLIQLSDKHEGEFTAEDEAIAVQLAQMASVAINNAQLYQEAQDAVKAREEFISIASHELRTPLTSLTLQLQSLVRAAQRDALDAQPPGQVLHRLEEAQSQVKRMGKLVNELLDLSRVTAGRLEIDLEEVELASVVREVTQRSHEELRLAGCKLTLKIDAPVTGLWDHFRLDQVVANLLSNAIKYGRGKPIEIKVEADADTARLTVRDEGIGIAPDNLERIFVRFERAVSARNYSGLGLGLYIVHRILGVLGGTIHVTSELGKGATFVVELPRGAHKD